MGEGEGEGIESQSLGWHPTVGSPGQTKDLVGTSGKEYVYDASYAKSTGVSSEVGGIVRPGGARGVYHGLRTGQGLDIATPLPPPRCPACNAQPAFHLLMPVAAGEQALVEAAAG